MTDVELLENACLRNCDEVMEELLRRSPGNARSVSARAIVQVCQEGDVRALRMLVENGADVNARDTDTEWVDAYAANTPLMVMAGVHGDLEMTRYLLDKGADARLRSRDEPGEGFTATDLARMSGHAEVAKLLEEHVTTEN